MAYDEQDYEAWTLGVLELEIGRAKERLSAAQRIRETLGAEWHGVLDKLVERYMTTVAEMLIEQEKQKASKAPR